MPPRPSSFSFQRASETSNGPNAPRAPLAPHAEETRAADLDPSLGARVVARRALFYAAGAAAALDRPAHVRAGSGLARMATPGGVRFAIIQDDANFLAVIDEHGSVHDVPLPARDGVRQFDEGRGNKKHKLDLEACVVTADAALLVAFGSGSSAERERIVVITNPSIDRAAPAPTVTVVEARELYAQMRALRSFCGSELNVEGAIVAGDDLVLLQRGNGAPSEDFAAVDATVRISWAPFLAYVQALVDETRNASDVDTAECPPLRAVRRWNLGSADGVRLTFTDGALAPGNHIAFLACAEASPDATCDGPVSGVAIGRLDDVDGQARLAPVLDEHGSSLLDKAEGLTFDPIDRSRAWVVVDRDDPTCPSELLELRLEAGWAS